MSLRIPLSPDQTLQTEFHEIERRLRRLEKRTGVSAGSTTIQVLGGGVGVTNLQPLITRIEALEAVVAAIPDPDDFDIDVFGAVGPSSATGIVPEPGVVEPPEGLETHVLLEDATWGYPLRGLVMVATEGSQTDPPYDVVDIHGGLHTGGVSAGEIVAGKVIVLGPLVLAGYIACSEDELTLAGLV